MLSHVSGAHLNPAVTIGAVIVGLKTIPTAAVYILGQFIGATAGYGLLKVLLLRIYYRMFQRAKYNIISQSAS